MWRTHDECQRGGDKRGASVCDPAGVRGILLPEAMRAVAPDSGADEDGPATTAGSDGVNAVSNEDDEDGRDD